MSVVEVRVGGSYLGSGTQSVMRILNIFVGIMKDCLKRSLPEVMFSGYHMVPKLMCADVLAGK